MTNVSVTTDPNEAPVVSTPLFNLKARRDELVKDLFIDLRVPRFTEPEVWVRYSPVDPVKWADSIKARQDKKTKDWSILANADALVESCVGVYATLDGDTEKKYSLRLGDENGAWTKFDDDLRQALGLHEDARTINVIRALYLTDGDLVAASNQLFEFSGIASEQADKDF